MIVADGFREADLSALIKLLHVEGAEAKPIAPHHGKVNSDKGKDFKVDFMLTTATSVLFDAVFVPGSASTALQKNANALRFAAEAYRHCKPVAIAVDATFIKLSGIETAVGKSFKAGKDYAGEGLIYATDSKFLADNFVEAMKQYRFWAREKQDLPFF